MATNLNVIGRLGLAGGSERLAGGVVSQVFCRKLSGILTTYTAI